MKIKIDISEVARKEIAFDLADCITSYLAESWGLMPSEFLIVIEE